MIRSLNPSNHNTELGYTIFLIRIVEENKRQYTNYKIGVSDDISENRLVHMKVLQVLEQLGFPMDEAGTYFYKDIIVKTMACLDGTDNFGKLITFEELLQNLKNPYSQFYFDLARNEMDLGLKTFHSHIEHAVENVDYSVADVALLLDIYGNFSKDADYGEHAVAIARHMKGVCQQKTGYQYTIMPPLGTQTNI